MERIFEHCQQQAKSNDKEDPTTANLQHFGKILACHDLNSLLKPAFSHFLDSISGSRSATTRTITTRYRDELILLVELLLNGYSLRHFHSGWAEHQHDLIRRYHKSHSDAKNLLKSLFSLAVWPYTMAKLDSLIVKLQEHRDANQSIKQRIFALAVKVIPFIKKLFLLLNIRTAVRFMRGASPFTSVLLEFLGVSIHQRSEADVLRRKGYWTFASIVHWLLRCLGGAATGLTLLLQFWSASADDIRTVLSLAIPPIPQQQMPPGIKQSAGRRDHCPICGKKHFVEPVAVRETGLVFCRKCISPYIAVHGQCPLTRTALTHESLVRIFPN